MALITCKECGALVSEFARECPSCGTSFADMAGKDPIQPKQVVSQPEQPQQQYTLQEQPPKSWMVESMLVLILCCMPFGIVGLINAVKVELYWEYGAKDKAQQASNDAKKWTTIGFFGGIILYAILTLIYVMDRVHYGSLLNTYSW